MQPFVVKSHGRDFAIVGEGYMVLKDQYDSEQQWFSFMDKTVFKVFPAPKPPEPYVAARIPKNAYVAIPEGSRGPPEVKAPQLCLMFPQFKRLTRKEFKTVTKLKFPMWDIAHNGQPYTVELNAEWRRPSEDQRKTIIDWCDDQLARRYWLAPDRIVCEARNDSILVKLKFG